MTQIQIDVVPLIERHLVMDGARDDVARRDSPRGWTAVMKRSPAALRK